ncbi:MAG: hypothetical protein PHH11_15085 [Methylomonas sp.]|nr:hypothetical protein [Methylomonas sp.]
MKISNISIALMLLLAINACGNAGQINAHSMKTAHKSVSYIKEHLPLEQKVEFEVAYWALRSRIKNDNDFLQAIEGKTATDLIALAKVDFAGQKAKGVKEYAEYESWEQMLEAQITRRKAQDLGAVDTRDKKSYPRVDYKMHSM